MSRAVIEQEPYIPRGASFALFHSQAFECLISGPAGTGKSIGCLWKLHLLADKVPGVRGLIVRKTRASLTESVLVTYEEKILAPDSPILASGGKRRIRQAYQYPNGSTIVLGGMDTATRTFSTEYDLIYVPEAIELTENDWETLIRPLRNGVLPYQQLLADTNPDSPQHWLKKRCDVGKTKLFDSRHEDNPLIWDASSKDWTPFGRSYLRKLDQLTGARLQRLRHGRWVQAEGVVYEEWDRAVHVIDRFPIPDDWPRYWVVDFGYVNPFVWQAWAEDPDGRLYRYREIYRTKTLVEDHAPAILAATRGEPKPRAVICDHDAEDRATLERHLGMTTKAAIKDVSPGIQAVASRLRKAGDGKARLFFLRDSLVRRDAELADAKLPCGTDEEWDSYVWDTGNNRRRGEDPLKRNDHGLDCVRYLVAHFDLKVKRKIGVW